MAASKEGCFSYRIISPWRRQDGGQPCGLVGCQVAGGLLKVMTGRGFSAIDTLTPLGNVEIQLKNTFLCEMMFERACNQSFPHLSKQGPFG